MAVLPHQLYFRDLASRPLAFLLCDVGARVIAYINDKFATGNGPGDCHLGAANQNCVVFCKVVHKGRSVTIETTQEQYSKGLNLLSAFVLWH
jgi:hypothetical protein